MPAGMRARGLAPVAGRTCDTPINQQPVNPNLFVAATLHCVFDVQTAANAMVATMQLITIGGSPLQNCVNVALYLPGATTPSAENNTADNTACLPAAAANHRLDLQGMDVSRYLNSGEWYSWRPGARNNGQVVIPAGARIEIAGTMPPGPKLRRITPSTGWTCDDPAGGPPVTAMRNYDATLTSFTIRCWTVLQAPMLPGDEVYYVDADLWAGVDVTTSEGVLAPGMRTSWRVTLSLPRDNGQFAPAVEADLSNNQAGWAP
jgi:hypothetical protein